MRLILACCFVMTLATLNVAMADDRPNVIFILADDLGIGDISPTNPQSKIATPNLQQLADAGMTFTDAHTSSSVCTPTRYGLMTGRYNWRSRLAKGVLMGDSDHLIPAKRPTVAHLMRNAGYQTAMIGKWHLGWDFARDSKGKIDFHGQVTNGPDINGFDFYHGLCGSLDMPPYVWVENGRVTAAPDRIEGVTQEESPYGWFRKGPVGSDFQIENALPYLFDKSTAYVLDRAKEGNAAKPFFLYLPLPAPHTPILPNEPFRDASGINAYADFVMQVDHHVGQLMQTLRHSKFDDNTIVFFSSDNGCSPSANFEKLAEFEHDPSGPYRGHKADLYEGGHRVPLIVSWPGRVASGTRSDAMVCLTDFYATMREMLGVQEDGGGEDSFSLLPALEGKPKTARETLVSHSIHGKFAIRQGEWKLCFCPGSGGWSTPRDEQAARQGLPPFQLFHLGNDLAEFKNVIKENPEQVEKLTNALEKIVANGRSTPGPKVTNDREVTFAP